MSRRARGPQQLEKNRRALRERTRAVPQTPLREGSSHMFALKVLSEALLTRQASSKSSRIAPVSGAVRSIPFDGWGIVPQVTTRAAPAASRSS